MSTLSSTSTDAEVWAAYDDAASYEEDGDAAKAAAFVTACRILLRRRPKRSQRGGQGGSEIEFEPQQIAAELLAARKWLLIHGPTGQARRVVDVSLESFRD